MECEVSIEEILKSHSREIQERGISVLYESDPKFQWDSSPELESALSALFRFVFSTVPDGCEVFVAGSRPLVPVAKIEAGELTLRWQVVGEHRVAQRGNVVSIRPLAGSGEAHLRSKQAAHLARLFEQAGWELTLTVTHEDQEIWAWARTR